MASKTTRTQASIKASLAALGFAPETGTQGVALAINGYTLRVSLVTNGARVDYGKAIEVERETTLDLLNGNENLVVLECVIRLLNQGYAPNSIILEKSYQLGRNKTKGHLDILVRDGEDNAFLMIECKAWEEYDTKSDGEPMVQLVSYLHQDPMAQVGCLYASRVINGVIEVKHLTLDNTVLVLDKARVGDKKVASAVLAGRSLFKEAPYAKPQKWLVESDLNSLEQNSGGTIFNGFMEILRRYAVSDKPNAFNKIFNLFICKIWDEEKEGDDRLDFQWLPDETAETVLGRLNGLYREGVNQFLHMEVVDHDWQEVLKKLNAVSGKPYDFSDIERMFTDLRLYKNNEFGFYEVYDQKTFRENAEIVRDVVRLLQDWRLRYDHRQPFLGEFFERLLNTSVKQESGQFFTPLPLARFICDALPFEQVIDYKIRSGDTKFLPHMIDYAAGSGHFLTEGMERVNRLLLDHVTAGGLKGKQKTNGKSWSTGYQWANEFVYGIEKDYRLAKTAKISCFLNGDGDANLIRANGLDHFVHSEDYPTAPALSLTMDKAKKYGLDNPSFDVVIANPPYSVAQYKQTIPNGADSFELWPFVGDDNDDIECLFLERTKHLLRPGGVAGVIFPSSILNNDGIAAKSRSLLLKYFEIVGIVHLGSSTFMAANVSTATLFLRRRDNDHWAQVNALVEHFLSTGQDNTIDGVENMFTTYAKEVRGLSLVDYLNALRLADRSIPFIEVLRKGFKAPKLSKKQASALTASQLEDLDHASFVEFARAQEAARLLDFALTRPQTTVFVKAPAGTDDQATFLGYQFSNRRGQEGLIPIKQNADGQVDGALYNEASPHDAARVSGVLYGAFNGSFSVPAALASTTKIVNLAGLIKFDRADYISEIGTPPNAPRGYNSPTKKLLDLVSFQSGLWQGKNGDLTKIRVLRNTELTHHGYGLDSKGGVLLDVEIKQLQDRTLNPGDIILEKSGGSDTLAVGRVGLFAGNGGPTSFSNFVSRMRVLDQSVVIPEYLWEVLNAIYRAGDTLPLQKGTSGIRNLDLDGYKNLDIPLPTLQEQTRIVRRARRLRAVAEGRQRQAETTFEIVDAHVWLSLFDKPSDTIGAHFTINPSKKLVSTHGLSDTDLVSVVPMENVSTDGTITSIKNIPLSEVKSGLTYFADGDVLFAKITPCMENGKGAIASGLSHGVGFGSTEFHVLREKGDIAKEILFRAIQQPRFRLQAKEHMVGSGGQLRVPASYLEQTKIRVPTHHEQANLISEINAAKTKRLRYQLKAKEMSEKRVQFLSSSLGIS